MSSTSVPFNDLAALTREMWPSIEREYLDCLLKADYVGAPAVGVFEQQWADYCGAQYAIGVGNGTDALELALAALEIGRGDEVIVPASTFIATAAAVVRTGATPRFADVSNSTLLLTPDTLLEAITPRTRAVIIVHLYGQMPDMPALRKVAEDAGIIVIEDAAQAHGAEWTGQRAGSFGDAACFSFYPGKNLGAFGDAGAVVTSRPEIAERVRSLANHGRSSGTAHNVHVSVGANSRLDSLQAIALRGKLAYLEEWTQRRMAIVARYRRSLGSLAPLMLEETADARHVYHLLVIRVPDRDRVFAELRAHGIQAGLHYPVPCHRQPPLQQFADRPLPIAEKAANEVLSLPLFPHMMGYQVDAVCDALSKVV